MFYYEDVNLKIQIGIVETGGTMTIHSSCKGKVDKIFLISNDLL